LLPLARLGSASRATCYNDAMRASGVLPLFFFGFVSFIAGTGACGGQVEQVTDGGASSSSSGGGSSSNSGGSGFGSSSGSSGVGSSGSSGFGSSTGSGSGGEGDSGFGSSSGVIDSGFADVVVGGDATQACTMGIPVLDPDGGMNVACESCLSTSCGNEQCACVQDPNLIAIDDAGTFAPGCDLFVNCVYGDFVQILLTTDAGATQALQQAISDCVGGGGPFTTGTIQLGENLISCIAANCAVQCVP
jgi:hypothetical protein